MWRLLTRPARPTVVLWMSFSHISLAWEVRMTAVCVQHCVTPGSYSPIQRNPTKQTQQPHSDQRGSCEDKHESCHLLFLESLAKIFHGKAFNCSFISVCIGVVQMPIAAWGFQRKIRTSVYMWQSVPHFSACMLTAHTVKLDQEGWTLDKNQRQMWELSTELCCKCTLKS